jgi:hypothetical protein
LTLPGLHKLLHLLSGFGEVDVKTLKNMGTYSVPLLDQAEKNMLGAEMLMA